MKKYLMMGALALTATTAFVSCSKEKDLYDPSMNAQKFIQDYQQAFIQVFGQPAANQAWGFDISTRATRSGNMTGQTAYPATHVYKDANGNVIAGANMNHNEWADPDKEFGGWVVPPALTDAQKAVVEAYFQANPNPDYEDPHFRHFFVQQVYKGGTTTKGATTEGIIAASGSEYSSDKMNLLTVGEANAHINDFNAGTCSESDVLDNGQHVGGTSHKDQITLMVNVDDTSCFGYHETGSSTHHNNKAGLVSWETIRDWANANGKNGDCLNDGWDRSFMGFDLAIKEGAQAYDIIDGNINYASYSQAPEAPKYAWDGEKIVEMGTFHREYPDYDNNPYWYYDVFDGYKDEYKNIFKDGEPIGWLTTNENFYKAANKVTLSQTISVNRAQASDITEIYDAPVLKDVMVGDTYYQSVINLPKIKQLVDAGYLPVKDKSLTEWVQVGVSDGYYSDWIVTLTEAKRISDGGHGDEITKIRVFGEDLSATEASDFDFNDVVFDAEKVDATHVKITLWAAGGTLPLRIYGNNVEQAFEVHNVLGTDTKCMTNTHAKDVAAWSAQYGNSWKDNCKDNEPYVKVITVDDMSTADYAENFPLAVRDLVKVEVYKGEGEDASWYELTAKKGEPTCKIACVDTTVRWMKERKQLVGSYPDFESYVGTGYPTNWWSTVQNGDNLYGTSGLSVICDICGVE